MIRMLAVAGVVISASLTFGAAPISAQRPSVRAQLVGRGLPRDLASQVAGVAGESGLRGLPVAPLVDKAAEGWAKRIPPERILAAVRELAHRLGEAREVLGTDAGGPVLTAAADALARGISRRDVASMVRVAPRADAAAAALIAAAALVAQGMGGAESARLVTAALRDRQPAARLLDLPAQARAQVGQARQGGPTIVRPEPRGRPQPGAHRP